jgi:hypothetical protein
MDGAAGGRRPGVARAGAGPRGGGHRGAALRRGSRQGLPAQHRAPDRRRAARGDRPL